MQLIIDQSLAAGFIPINTWQQRASLPCKPGVLERTVYNNDAITFFSVLTFAKPSCDNVLQPSPLNAVRAAKHYHTRAWQMLINGKECFILLLTLAGYEVAVESPGRLPIGPMHCMQISIFFTSCNITIKQKTTFQIFSLFSEKIDFHK